MSARRSSSACRISESIGPAACGMPSDEQRRPSGPGGTSRAAGGTSEPGVQHRSDIGRVIESAHGDDTWKQRIDVVVTGFRAAQGCGQIGRTLLRRGPCPPAPPSAGSIGSGRPTCRAARQRRWCRTRRRAGRCSTTRFLLGAEGCMRGLLRADVREHAEEHGPRRRRGVVGGMRRAVGVIGPVGRDVRDVRMPPSGHRDVKALPSTGGR